MTEPELGDAAALPAQKRLVAAISRRAGVALHDRDRPSTACEPDRRGQARNVPPTTTTRAGIGRAP